MPKPFFIPVKNCQVKHKTKPDTRGRVTYADEKVIKVLWQKAKNAMEVSYSEIECGFGFGAEVIDKTPYAGYQSLGEGVVIQKRILAGQEQLLVAFYNHEKVWFPYQYLAQYKGVKTRFKQGDISNSPVESEKLRLRTLAYAIELWNENTGALAHLEIDPLPHQINLVHHILSSGNLNWLIADDVGLGKTIEASMLIHALQQRGLVKRILLITPAGLVRQWQDELYHRFKLGKFEVYNEDFQVSESRFWKLHDQVIASIDTLKGETHLEMLLQSDDWDLVIFDEGHRLSRKQYGLIYQSSERFELASKIRTKTPSMLLLSATPHQGEQDKFIALLELLRPDRRSQLQMLSLKPDIIRDMVFRNHKADVTDHEGNFIFQGKTVKSLEVPHNDRFKTFEDDLAQYFKLGYSASREDNSTRGLAIGFVMTTYRKLAASSVNAIHVALLRRIAKIEQNHKAIQATALQDERYHGEMEEQQLELIDDLEFFTGELVMLKDLTAQSKQLIANDNKFNYFNDHVVKPILATDPSEKLLIFSEYRNTQSYLKDQLEALYGTDAVYLIHGSMTHQERNEAIKNFEMHGKFLISTEAGGEGINLQRACHILVNYDLPWNPMRLVQRIGRLYRYGQKHQVMVINLYQPDSLDQSLIKSMYGRIDRIVDDLAILQGNEFNDGLKDEILGELSNQIDISEILKEMQGTNIDRTEERIKEALDNAKEAVKNQRELLNYAASSDKNELKYEIKVTKAHIERFIEGMLQQHQIEFNKNGDIIRIRFDDTHQKRFKSILGKAHILEATADRITVSLKPNLHMFDLNSPILQYFIKQAKDYNFGGLSAYFLDNKQNITLCTALLKWQDNRGKIIKNQLCLVDTDQGIINHQSNSLDNYLNKPSETSILTSTARTDNDVYKQKTEFIDKTLNDFMAENTNLYTIPTEIQWVSVGSSP